MDLAYKQDRFYKTITMWTALAISLYLCAMGLKTFHSYQLNKIITVNMVTVQKASLITQMHNEMLLITRSQLQIMHASHEKQIKDQLWKLSGLVSGYLIHYHQLEKIADASDAQLLTEFRAGFNQWYKFNRDLLTYTSVISDSGFINTLNMIDLALTQFNSNTVETSQLISHIKYSSDFENGVSISGNFE